MEVKKRLVAGVGINDAEYKISRYLRTCGVSKQVWVCPIYRSWSNMLLRCYSTKHQFKSPTYAGCSVVDEWLRFSSFHSWAVSQPWEGNEIDKDLLFPGNRIYGPSFCIFISQNLNCFLTDHAARRGEWPLGVSLYTNGKKFLAHCNNPDTGKCEYLGGFLSPEAAHEAWRCRKHQHACAYADQQADPRIAAALRARYMPSNGGI